MAYFILPQLEEGPLSAPIVTQGAVTSVGNGSTVVASAEVPSLSANQALVSGYLSASPGANRWYLRRTFDGAFGVSIRADGVDQSNPAYVTGKAGARVLKGALTIKANSLAVAADGAALGATTSYQRDRDALVIGAAYDASQVLNGYVRALLVLGEIDDTQRARLTA